jgi:hypothetical protein
MADGQLSGVSADQTWAWGRDLWGMYPPPPTELATLKTKIAGGCKNIYATHMVAENISDKRCI